MSFISLQYIAQANNTAVLFMGIIFVGTGNSHGTEREVW